MKLNFLKLLEFIGKIAMMKLMPIKEMLVKKRGTIKTRNKFEYLRETVIYTAFINWYTQ